MPQFIEATGKIADKAVFALGAGWETAANQAAVSKTIRGSALAVSVKTDSEFLVSKLDSETAAKAEGKQVISGAALIAIREKNACVHHTLDDGRVWVAGVRDGTPLPDQDTVTTVEDAREKLTVLMQIIPSHKLIGNDNDCDRSIERVFESATEEDLVASAYKKPKSRLRAVFIFLAVMAILAVALIAANEIKAARDLAEQAQAAALAKMNEAQRVEEIIRQYDTELRIQTERARDELRFITSAKEQYQLWMRAASNIQLLNEDFRLESITCDTKSCKLSWQALVYGSLAGPPDQDKESREDNKLTTSVELVGLEKIPRGKQSRIDILSRFHALGPGASANLQFPANLQPIIVPVPPKPDVPDEMKQKFAAVTPVMIGKKTDVLLTTTLSYAQEAVDLLGDSVRLSNFEIAPMSTTTGAPTTPQIKIGGEYVSILQ